MARRLPKLRTNLDFMPSPLPDRPGLLIRDAYQYSEATLIIPPALVACLQCFDGERTDLDLREMLVRLTGDLRVGELQQHLVESLSQAGFLEDEVYARLKEERERAFRESPVRAPAHAGSAYPDEPEALRRTLEGYFQGAPPARSKLTAVVAPHVSPAGGWRCYQAAYAALGTEYRDRTFVVLGTSHYGAPEKFGLTHKPYVTPLGTATTDTALVNYLVEAAGSAIVLEDYCHAVEHSVEFQVVFLQHLFGGEIRILPILCGPYSRSLIEGGRPEDDDAVKRFLEALGELATREGDRLLWVLGIDMAHMGRRYGDPFAARAHQDGMVAVARRDEQRLERVLAGDARGFWELVQENRDDLKWCGASALYTFLKAVPQARGELLRYEQWNIDEQSVVSFAALAFRI
ncbi:MAG: AmmeMemoRadiSam system protein B [Bryobacterales bacterium]|nr:AmmeMemoRadiSam system protein B [Bryobacteraceae bacterium]MDW8355444.1 AmmeMemoRadiSam system protein B [Bryobacterales bacterium]